MADLKIQKLRRSNDPEDRAKRIRALVRTGMTATEAWCEVYGYSPADVGERKTETGSHRIIIDGERYHVTNVRRVGFGDLHEIETEEGETFILSEDSETAGAAARERWEDMANNDPEEFTCIVGERTLVAWALGQPASPGNVHVRSLTEWLDLTATVPEEEWASYDGNERTVDRVGKLVTELDFQPTVAYRSN